MPTSALVTGVELLRRRALEAPEQEAYFFLGDGEAESARLTFGELDARARNIGAMLQGLVEPGERVLLLYPPGLEFICGFFGCLYGGAVAVPAYPPRARAGRGQPRLRSIVQDARPRAVLTTGEIASRIEAAIPQVPELAGVICLTDGRPAGLTSPANEWQDPGVAPDTLAFLQYTSGSTAEPRGVMVTHHNLLYNEEMIRLAFGQSQDSVVVGWLPSYHDMGLIGNILQPLYVGGRCVLMSPLAFLQRPFRWLAAISRYRATTSGGPNFAYELCLHRISEEQRAGLDLSSWQVAFTGAEPVRADTLERFAAAFGPCGFDSKAFYPCYGLAEATLFVSGGDRARRPVVAELDAAALEQGRADTASKNTGTRRLVGCGAAWADQELRIIDPQSCQPCPFGEVGEVWVAGPSVAAGYWNRPEETRQVFHAMAADGSGPWLRTGDLGFIADGELFITGRIKDLIILRGRNLYPQDLELTAEQSHSALRPGCGAAFGVEVDGTEELVLVQEIERSAKTEAPAAVAAVRAAIVQEFEIQPHDVLLVAPGVVPKTSSGKVQRRATRDLYLANRLEPLARSTAGEARTRCRHGAGELARSGRG